MATLVSTLPQQAAPQNPAGTAPYQISQAAQDLLGPTAGGTANALYAAPGVTPQDANTAVGGLFNAGIQSNSLDTTAAATAAQDIAQGQAQGIIAQGDQAESNAYLQAGAVADTNARLARASAGIQSAQEDRNIYKAVGGQQSDIAGAGFGSGNSGTSSLFLMADSVHQGALAKQLIGVQGEITAGGFQQQSLAAQAESAAAAAAGGAASTLGAAATAAAGTVTDNATQTGTALQTNALNSAMSLLGNSSGGGGVTSANALSANAQIGSNPANSLTANAKIANGGFPSEMNIPFQKATSFNFRVIDNNPGPDISLGSNVGAAAPADMYQPGSGSGVSPQDVTS